MKVLSLFAGIGGFDLGFERAGMNVVAQCEIDPWCQKILNKHWPEVPIYEDVKNLSKEKLNDDGIGSIDLICGGYPCQPFSLAGQRQGANDNRHLWPEVFRLVKSIRPKFCVFENVYGHISMGYDQVASELEAVGYKTESFVIPSCAVGLPHKRERLWIVAYDGGQLRKTRQSQKSESFQLAFAPSAEWSDFFIQPCGNNTFQFRKEDEHIICGEDDGVPSRVDRLRGLGNTVVPQIPEIIGRAIMNVTA